MFASHSFSMIQEDVHFTKPGVPLSRHAVIICCLHCWTRGTYWDCCVPCIVTLLATPCTALLAQRELNRIVWFLCAAPHGSFVQHLFTKGKQLRRPARERLRKLTNQERATGSIRSSRSSGSAKEKQDLQLSFREGDIRVWKRTE